MEHTTEINQNFATEIIYCGIGQHESVLHFGACDKGLDFLKTLDEFGLDIEYTAVDIDDEVIPSTNISQYHVPVLLP